MRNHKANCRIYSIGYSTPMLEQSNKYNLTANTSLDTNTF